MSAVLSIHLAMTAEVNPYGLSQPMVCEFTYDEGEAPRITGPIEIAHPGWPPSVEVLSCKVAGVEWIDALTSSQRLRVEEAILEQLES